MSRGSLKKEDRGFEAQSPTQYDVKHIGAYKISHRIPFLQREKSAYLILRRVGLSINQISKAFGRSTSVIHKILVRAEKYGHNLDVWCRRLDLRKLPRKKRLIVASFLWRKLLSLLSAWEMWIAGEEGKPP